MCIQYKKVILKYLQISNLSSLANFKYEQSKINNSFSSKTVIKLHNFHNFYFLN